MKYPVCEEWLDKKHNTKSSCADNINLMPTFRRYYTGSKVKQDSCYDPACDCTKGIGYQIINISGAIGEDLKNFNEKGNEEAKLDGFLPTAKSCPAKRKNHPHREEKKDVQEAVQGIGEHVPKGNEVKMGIKSNIVDVRKTYHRKHAAQIHRKQKIKKCAKPMMETMLIEKIEYGCQQNGGDGCIQAHGKDPEHDGTPFLRERAW